MNRLTFGLLLPSYASIDKHPLVPATLVDLAQSAEGLGFDSIWTIDHLLKPDVYVQSWLEPLVTLAFLASATKRVKLGPSVLIAALRNPVLLAKEVAALQFLSNNRFILGIGTGGEPREFDAVGVPRQERGSRTDEIIGILRSLLSEPSASHAGQHYQFREVSIEPRPTSSVPIWVGGGTRPQLEGSTEMKARAPERVIQRIARADGWSTLPLATATELAADWERIQAAARDIGRSATDIVFAHMNYFHVVDTDDRDRAHDEQRRYFEQFDELTRRPWSYIQNSYLVGSISDIVEGIRSRAAVGVNYFILGPVTTNPEALERQLDLLVHKVLPELSNGTNA